MAACQERQMVDCEQRMNGKKRKNIKERKSGCSCDWQRVHGFMHGHVPLGGCEMH